MSYRGLKRAMKKTSSDLLDIIGGNLYGVPRKKWWIIRESDKSYKKRILTQLKKGIKGEIIK